MTNLTDMTRSELKAFVRKHGWDEGDGAIDLRSGTDEIRALCVERSQRAETIPPPPDATEAPDVDKAAMLAPESEEGQDDPAPAPEKSATSEEERAQMTVFAMIFGGHSFADVKALSDADLLALCMALDEIVNDEVALAKLREHFGEPDPDRPLTMDDVMTWVETYEGSKRDVKPENAPAPVMTYRVERYAKWVRDGVVHQLRAGCIVSAANYPIDELRAQGVPLVEAPDARDDDPGIGHRFT